MKKFISLNFLTILLFLPTQVLCSSNQPSGSFNNLTLENIQRQVTVLAAQAWKQSCDLVYQQIEPKNQKNPSTQARQVTDDYVTDYQEKMTFEKFSNMASTQALKESVQNSKQMSGAIGQLNDVTTSLFEDPRYNTSDLQDKIFKTVSIAETVATETKTEYELAKALARLYHEKQNNLLKQKITADATKSEPDFKQKHDQAVNVATTKKERSIQAANSLWSQETEKAKQIYENGIEGLRMNTAKIAHIQRYLDKIVAQKKEVVQDSKSHNIHYEEETHYKNNEAFLQLLQLISKCN